MPGSIKSNLLRKVGIEHDLVSEIEEIDDRVNQPYIKEANKLLKQKSPRSSIVMSWGLFIAFLCSRIERHGLKVFSKKLDQRTGNSDVDDLEDLYKNVKDFELLSQASNQGIIRESQKERAENLLNERNDAAHYNSKKIREPEAENYISRINNLIEDIKSVELIRDYEKVMQELKNREENSIPHYDFDSERIAEIGDPVKREIKEEIENKNLLIFIREVIQTSNNSENLIKYSKISISLFKKFLDDSYFEEEKELVFEIIRSSSRNYAFAESLDEETTDKLCHIFREVEGDAEISIAISLLRESYFQQAPKTQLKMIKTASQNEKLISNEQLRVTLESEIPTFKQLDEEIKERYREAGYNI